MQYFQHRNIDFELWDECINSSINGNIYTLSWYLNVVAPEWDALIEVVDDKYLSVFPITHFKKFGIFRFVRQPHFANQLGLIHRNSKSENVLIESIHKLKTNFKYIHEYPLNRSNTCLFDKPILNPPDNQIKITRYPCYEINITSTYEQVINKFSVDRKNNIKRSLKNGLQLEETDDIETLLRIFLNHTSKRIYGGVSDHQYQLLRKLFKEAPKRGLAKIFHVKKNDVVVASSLFFFYKKRIIKFFNGSTDQGRNLNADSFMMSELLKTWCACGYESLDLERGSLEGINKYKESFGAEVYFYPGISFNGLPEGLKFLQRLRIKIFRTFYKGAR